MINLLIKRRKVPTSNAHKCMKNVLKWNILLFPAFFCLYLQCKITISKNFLLISSPLLTVVQWACKKENLKSKSQKKVNTIETM